MTILASISVLAVVGVRGWAAKKQKRKAESPQTRPISEDASVFGGGDIGLSESDVVRQLYKDPDEPAKPQPAILVLETPEAHGARILARIREGARSERPTPMIVVVDDEPHASRRPSRAVRPQTRIAHAESVTLKSGEVLPCTIVRRCENGSLILNTPRGTMRKKKRYVRTAT